MADMNPANVARGNLITFKPLESAALLGLNVIGKTTQNGTPTLDAPVALVSAGKTGSVGVAVYGKNLLPRFSGNMTGDGIAAQVNADGSVTLNGTVTTRVVLNFLTTANQWRIADGTYTVSTGVPLPKGVRFTTEWYLGGKWQRTLGVVREGNSADTFEAIQYDVLAAYISVDVGTTLENFTIYPQLEVGATATAYEPYKAPQTITLSTPNGLMGIPVTSGGNYMDANGQQWIADEIDLERGVYVHRTKRFILPVAGLDNNDTYPGWKNVDGLRDCVPSEANGLLRSYVQGYLVNIGSAVCVATASTSNLIFFYKKDVGGLTQTELKAQYPDLVVEIAMPLLEPYETDLSEAEINAYKALRTTVPVTTIYNADGADMQVVWRYGGWTAPKTNWKNGDYFNLDPDYTRIKGNILYIQDFSKRISKAIGLDGMAEYDVTQYPFAEFLNVIARNVQKLTDNVYLITPNAPMPMHVGNGPGWTAEELNDIENNLLNMYEDLHRQYALIPRLSIKMGIGGINFGN